MDKMRWLFLISNICFLPLIAHGTQIPFPDFNKITYGSFHSRVEITEKEMNLTSFAEEYFDVFEDMGRLDLLDNGLRTSIYYKNETRQLLAIDENGCDVKNLTGNNRDKNLFMDLYYGWFNFEGQMVFGPSALLRKNNFQQSEYQSETVVRGISSRMWKLQEGPVTIEYHFSAPNWTHPFPAPGSEVPVRIRVSGTVQRSGEEMPIDQVFDYVFFDPIIEDSRVLEPPVGIGCEGLENEMTVPELPSQFSLVAEVSKSDGEEHQESRVDIYRVWYDRPNRMARIDSFVETGTVSQLSDFNTGVMYEIRGVGNCELKPLRYQFFDTSSTLFSDMMSDEYRVFRLTGNVYYLGETYTRGIRCGIWETVHKKVKIGEKEYRTVVYTYYFTSSWWEVVAEGEKETHVPVRVLVTGYDEDGKVSLREALNLFDFKNSAGPELYSTFNIEACFAVPSQKLYFYLTIPARTSAVGVAELESKLFTEKLKSVLLKTAGISPLRMPFLRVDFEKVGVAATGLILERPPYLASFYVIDAEAIPQEKSEPQEGEFTVPEVCAKFCLNAERTCRSFYFCDQGKANCFLNYLTEEESWGKNLEGYSNCMLFARDELNSTASDASANEALQNLQDAAKKQALLVEWEDSSSKKITPFVVKEVREVPNPFLQDRDETEYMVANVGFEFNSSSMTTREGLGSVSEDECYRQCKEDTRISCASFSYCKDSSRRCQLSSLLTTENITEAISEGTNCKIYSRSYIQLFDKHPGIIPQEDGDKAKATTDVQCARACKEVGDCRSFAFCKSEGKCELFKRHVLDIKPDDLLPSGADCIFYSAKFIADYMYFGHTLVSGTPLSTFMEVPLEQCARFCSEQSNGQCKSFNYCPNTVAEGKTGMCFAFSATLDDGDTTTNDSCHHYTKKDAVDDWTKQQPDEDKVGKQIDDGGYSPGQLAGLLIGMIIFGAFLGVGGFVAYSYYRSKKIRDDGMSTAFHKR